MKLSFPTFGKSDKSAKATNPERAALDAQLATPEGRAALLVAAQTKKDATKGTRPNAHSHYVRVCEELQRLNEKTRLADWRTVAALARQTSLVESQKASTEAKQALALAEDALMAEEQRLAAIDARLEPLKAQHRAAQAEATQKAEAARENFNQVMLSGDEAAEDAASRAMFEAQQNALQAGGPLLLRIEALNAQRAYHEAAVMDAKKARDSAETDLHTALAAIALVVADDAGSAVVDAYLDAAAALRRAGRLPAGFRPIDPPVVQFSRQGHAMYSPRMDEYSNRIMSGFAIRDAAFLVPEPRYELLLAPEPAEEGSPAENTVQANEHDGPADSDSDNDSDSDQQQFYRQSGAEATGVRG